MITSTTGMLFDASRVNVPRPVRRLVILLATTMSACASWPMFTPPPETRPCNCAKTVPVAPTKADCPVAKSPLTQAKKPTPPATAAKQVTKTASTTATAQMTKPAAVDAKTKAKPSVAPKEVASQAVDKAPKSKKKEKLAPATKNKTRILIIGDSMAATDFGRELQKKLNKNKSMKCFRKGKSSTGLARPDYFDWMGEGARQVKRTNPDVVIVIVGGNDGQDLIDKEKKKRRVFWKGKKWAKAYAKRTTDLIDLLAGEKRQVIWLELPAMDHRSLEKKLKIIRKIQKDAIAPLSPRATYISTKQHFYTAKGQLIRKIKHGRKASKTDLRQEDGIHFSLPGSKYFANRVYKQVLSQLKQ